MNDDIIQPVLNEQTIEIEHEAHGIAHCDRSSLKEWEELGWKERTPAKPKTKPAGKTAD